MRPSISGLKILAFALLSTVVVGFRSFPGHWRISSSDPTIWIRLCSGSPTIEQYDIPSGDVLAGQTPSFQQIVQSVIDDYNSLQTSYLRLALYPSDPNNPGSPLPGDSTFTPAKGEVRTIDICFDGTAVSSGLSSGHAKPKHEMRDVVGCEIKGRPDSTKKARHVVQLLTHEIGHCIGLDHNQASVHAVMSYFIPDDLIRLADDDKIGVTYLYPKQPDYGNEEITLGATGCAPKD
jgi:hypothetical protein